MSERLDPNYLAQPDQSVGRVASAINSDYAETTRQARKDYDEWQKMLVNNMDAKGNPLNPDQKQAVMGQMQRLAPSAGINIDEAGNATYRADPFSVGQKHVQFAAKENFDRIEADAARNGRDIGQELTGVSTADMQLARAVSSDPSLSLKILDAMQGKLKPDNPENQQAIVAANRLKNNGVYNSTQLNQLMSDANKAGSMYNAFKTQFVTGDPNIKTNPLFNQANPTRVADVEGFYNNLMGSLSKMSNTYGEFSRAGAAVPQQTTPQQNTSPIPQAWGGGLTPPPPYQLNIPQQPLPRAQQVNPVPPVPYQPDSQEQYDIGQFIQNLTDYAKRSNLSLRGGMDAAATENETTPLYRSSRQNSKKKKGKGR